MGKTKCYKYERRYQIGPFSVEVTTNLNNVLASLDRFYGCFSSPASSFIDFRVSLEQGKGLRRWVRPQVNFVFDGVQPFKPLPKDQAVALFEWGLNWCMTNHCHEYLTVHAAVVEKAGRCLVLPAPPGAGKSTLCAALVCSGWRLLSDELTLIELSDGNKIVPLCRPVCLKNESISIIREFSPQAEFGEVCKGTTKGDVSHMIAPKAHVATIENRAPAKWIIFPRYVKGKGATMSPRSKATTFFEMARQSFNFHVLGMTGFKALENVIGASDCFDFEYSSLEDAVSMINNLSHETRSRELVHDEC
ncbi:MAG: HprK-related kinase A [Cellvibrionaceae bacterium]